MSKHLHSPLHSNAQRLDQLFAQSGAAYLQYMSNGKTYQHAKVLKGINEQIKALLLEVAHLLPVEIHAAADSLSSHIDSWLGQWNEIKTTMLPQPETQFVFNSKVPFPKEAELRIRNYFKQLIEAKHSDTANEPPE